MIKYISKGTWFDEGEECRVIHLYDGFGLFEGYRTCQNPKSESRELGEKYLDQELCSLDEFEIVEDKEEADRSEMRYGETK